MKKKSILQLTVAVATVAVSFTACGIDVPKETKSSFETMTVKKSDIELPYKFSAKMKGQNDVTVTPQVSGQLMKICVKKIVSSYMLNNSENSYKQAQASVAQARSAVNRAKVNLGFCTITATVPGIIGEIPVRVGDQVSPMTQLTMLSGNTTMYAEFSVTEAIVEAMVKQGMNASDVDKYIANLPPATFVMKNGTEYPHKGRVISLTGVVNSETGSLTSKVSFPNPDGHLYSGIQGTIVMPFAEKSVIVVPQYAVVRLQDKAQVFKVKADSTATAIEVTTEDTGNGKDFIVTSGLKEGDQIVTTGANNVTEGQKVLFSKEEVEGE